MMKNKTMIRNVVFFLLLGCCMHRKIVVTAATKSNSLLSLDFSYLHRVKSSILREAIQQNIALSLPNSNSDDDGDTALHTDDAVVVNLDVSASMIGKDVKDLVASLEESYPSRVSLQLTARANQWTMEDATVLLQTIVQKEKQAIESKKKKETLNTRAVSSIDNVETEVSITENVTDSESNVTIAIDSNETVVNSNETVLDSNETSVDSNETLIDSNETSTDSNSSTTSISLDSDENQTTTTMSEERENEDTPSLFPLSIESLDLSWNNFVPSSSTKSSSRRTKAFFEALQNTIESKTSCPTTLRLEVCGLGPGACRAIGKGIIARHKTEVETTKDDQEENVTVDDDVVPPLLSLYLTRNDIGDAGAAALAAAIRTVADAKKKATMKEKDDVDNDTLVLDVLDLSGCDIGDTGVEALAIALEMHSIRHLDLSNNQITDEGAIVLGRALEKSGNKKPLSLDLSHNKDLGNVGAKAIAEAMEKGAFCHLVMRSCHIQADGAACFANALKHLGRGITNDDGSIIKPPPCLDLSGNPLGILRKKSKSGGGKYSATALKSKATATTAAYMNLIGKTVAKGLKDLGIADSPDTLESDDEEEAKMNGEDDDDDDPSKVKCGALAFASAFIEDEEEGEEQEDTVMDESIKSEGCTIDFGLRQCAFDTKAAEALAAVRQEAKSRYSMDLVIDARMNNVLEDEMIASLKGDPNYESELAEMAERHMEAMEVLRAARQRSIDAARAAAARMRQEREMEAEWDAPPGFDDEEAWDSDADYDDPEDSYGFV